MTGSHAADPIYTMTQRLYKYINKKLQVLHSVGIDKDLSLTETETAVLCFNRSRESTNFKYQLLSRESSGG